MSSQKFVPTAAATAILAFLTLSPAPLAAQGLAAADLWVSWQEASASAGGKLEAVETREGNKLVLKDVSFTPDLEEESSIHLDQLVLVSQADGSVSVIFPERFPLMIGLPPTPEEGDAERVIFDVAAPDLEMVIFGIGDRAEFQAHGASVSLSLKEVQPAPAAGSELALTAAAADLSLRYKLDRAAKTPSVDSALTMGSLLAEMSFGDGTDVLTTSLSTSGLDLALKMMMPASAHDLHEGGAIPAAQLLQSLSEGLLVNGKASLGLTQIGVTVTSPDDAGVKLQTAFETFASDLTLDQSKLAWGAEISAFSALSNGKSLDGSDLAGALSLGEFRQSMSFGLNDLVTPQDWSVTHIIRDVHLDQNFWALIEPSGLLPNTPLSLAVDLAGKYALDPLALAEGGESAPDAPPPLAHFDLSIKELLLDGLGLHVTGEGGLAFDFKDLTTYDGMPAPQGELRFVTKGAYALLERLAKLQLIDADQASAARMALLFVGKAGEEPDHLNTDLVLKGKDILLNGQKLP